MAVDMVRPSDLGISKAEAVSRVTEDHLDSVLHPQFAGSGYATWAKGLGASPGAAVGRIYFTADEAAEAAARGEQVILVRNETSPEDVHGMLASEGILTARGGLVSHAAVVARGWGKPAVVGAEALRLADHSVTAGDVTLYEGDWVSLDGAAGIVVAGEVPLTSASPPEAFDTVLAWADDIRKGHLAVRANADTGDDAANARTLGAEGIGLCRTEHMFLGEDRLPVVRRMILSHSPSEEAEALEELRMVQREDFIAILAAMDGLPVTVRLLDPPLHEFLPSTEDLARKDATVGLNPEERRLYEAALAWREANPMLGTRGVRLGVIKPGLYAMQVRALMEAARQRVADGGHPIVEIMIPLTVTREELALARGWVEDAVADVNKEPAPRPSKKAKNGAGAGADAGAKAGTLEVTIGTMIETPRAALRAAEIAEVADFFSFGTNDLTQMTFGFSRDDVEGRMMDAYLEHGLLPRNPFEVVDFDGVGELVRLGVERGRATRPDLKVGVCGEHGGEPASIDLFFRAGLDYVSCSPFRVPVARLAAAQAVLAGAPADASKAKKAPKKAKAS
jgi:pyruvate,orthophosphate dikinase